MLESGLATVADDGFEPSSPATGHVPSWRGTSAAALRRAHTTAKARTLELSVALESALLAYERASKNAQGSGQSAIPKLEESFALTRSAFDAGRVSYFEVLDALLALIRARRTQLDHLEEQALAAAEIRYLTGSW